MRPLLTQDPAALRDPLHVDQVVSISVHVDTVCPYSIGRKRMSTDEGINGVELELTCPCGYENFERVIVQRRPHQPIVTDFVACVGCRAMYWAPQAVPLPLEQRPGHGMMGIGGPEKQPIDSTAALKRDAAKAVKDYRKPGRSGKLKPGGRQ
ncbi:MAG: hypothetical protein ABIQ33_03690 [Caldimonas sp.]